MPYNGDGATEWHDTDRIDIVQLLDEKSFSNALKLVNLQRGERLKLVTNKTCGQILVDKFFDTDILCAHFRIDKVASGTIEIHFPGHYSLTQCSAGGWLLQGQSSNSDCFWIPTHPKLRRLDQYQRVLSEKDTDLCGFGYCPESTSIKLRFQPGYHLDAVLWRIPSHEINFLYSLNSLEPIENQTYFLWGSHTNYQRPADLYIHLIHGLIYENRYAWPHRRKINSENDAHALSVILCGLEKHTNKALYRLLQTQLLLSVISRQNIDGGWYHGEWTDELEAHFRLNGSAAHMLMDAFEEQADPAIQSALKNALEFISRQSDQLHSGVWFLHDQLEHDGDEMAKAPFDWIKCTAFGKSKSNMLVINTHLDLMIALGRYEKLTGDKKYSELVFSARNSAREVLQSRPAEWLYKLLFSMINLTLLPSDRAAALPLPLRAVKRIAWKYIVPNLHRVKVRYPRLVMPGGYIDRAIPLKSWAFHYLTVNIMDLLRYKRTFTDKSFDDIITDALVFTQTSGVKERWMELRYERYALGFWAEALYHCCTLYEDSTYRDWLAEAVLILDKLNMGVPPSCLGWNREICSRRSFSAPLPTDSRLRTIYINGASEQEILIINTSDQTLDLEWSSQSNCSKSWNLCDKSGQSMNAPLTIQARSWVKGTAS